MTEQVETGDLFSDDSSFYGDNDTKALYKGAVIQFEPRDFLAIQRWNLRCITAQNESPVRQLPPAHGLKRQLDESPMPNVSKRPNINGSASNTTSLDIADATSNNYAVVPIKNTLEPCQGRKQEPESETASTSPPPVNPYAGEKMAWQLGETIPSFLSRLPPSTTKAHEGPWIWAANPFSRRQNTSEDVAGFMRAAQNALEQYENNEAVTRSENPDKAKGTITRLLKPHREQLEQEIFNLAISHRVTCGKWMLFPDHKSVDQIWSSVAKATTEGKLGCGAKVSTDDGDPKPERLVCVYTDSFMDREDVRKVLKNMTKLGLVKDKVIYYKCDAYTYLDIKSGNEYGLKASLYSSRDMA